MNKLVYFTNLPISLHNRIDTGHASDIIHVILRNRLLQLLQFASRLPRRVDTPTERRLKRWAFNLRELLHDATGRQEFEMFLEKEYSSENIHFYQAVEDLKQLPLAKVSEKVQEIFRYSIGQSRGLLFVDLQIRKAVLHNVFVNKLNPFNAKLLRV